MEEPEDVWPQTEAPKEPTWKDFVIYCIVAYVLNFIFFKFIASPMDEEQKVIATIALVVSPISFPVVLLGGILYILAMSIKALSHFLF